MLYVTNFLNKIYMAVLRKSSTLNVQYERNEMNYLLWLIKYILLDCVVCKNKKKAIAFFKSKFEFVNNLLSKQLINNKKYNY